MDEGRPAQVLPVGDGGEAVDLSRPPTDALEYLRQVRYEASQIPDIVVSPNQRRMPQAPAPAPATAAVPDHRAGGGEIDAITAFRDWQQHQVRAFTDLRQVINRWRARGVPAKSVVGMPVTLPAMTDGQNWRYWILGTPSKSLPPTQDAAASRGRRPLLQLLLQLNQTQVKRLLEHNLEWLTEQHLFTDVQGEWLYGLLACLAKPIDADTTACLRNICKECCALVVQIEAAKVQQLGRSPAHPGDSAGLHLFITLVGHYFGQIDLQS